MTSRVNESLLNTSERNRVRQLIAGNLRELSVAEKYGGLGRTWLALVVWLCGTLALVGAAVWAPPGEPGGIVRTLFVLFLAVALLGGAIVVFVQFVRDHDRQIDRLVDAYLDGIGYRSRAQPSPPAAAKADSDDGRWYHTGSYDPQRWFNYSKGARDFMRQTGIDADTYDSNVE